MRGRAAADADIEPAAHADTPEAHTTRRQLVGLLAAALADLPPVLREVVTLRDVEDCDAAEVSARLAITDGHQRVLLHRARLRLRAALAT